MSVTLCAVEMFGLYDYQLPQSMADPFRSWRLSLGAEASDHWAHRANVSGYEPAEVTITPSGSKIMVHGVHKGGDDYGEFKRVVDAPPTADLNSVRTSFTPHHLVASTNATNSLKQVSEVA